MWDYAGQDWFAPYCEGGEALEQLAREFVDVPSLKVQSQVGWDSEKPALVENVPTHGRGVGTRSSLRFLSTQTMLWFCDYFKYAT